MDFIQKRYTNWQKMYYYLLVPVVFLYAMVIIINLSSDKLMYLSPCFLFDSTGIECPGCGATRAISCILCFRFDEAFRYNVVFTVLFFVGSLLYLQNLHLIITKNQTLQIKTTFYYAILIALILFTIIRNTPLYPVDLSHMPSAK